MREQIPHVKLQLSKSQYAVAARLSKLLSQGHTIAIVSPPRYPASAIGREIVKEVSTQSLTWKSVEIELDRFAFHPAPLPAIYAEILKSLGVAAQIQMSDQLFETLHATVDNWRRGIVLFHMIDALPKKDQMELAVVIRRFGNDEVLNRRIRPIVTGGVGLLGLTRHNDLGISPLNGATVEDLLPLSIEDIVEVFHWPDFIEDDAFMKRAAAESIKRYTGGHPGLVSLLVERLANVNERFQLQSAADVERIIPQAALSPEVLDHPFVVRSLQPLKTSLPLFQTALKVLSGARDIDRVHADALRFTGAVTDDGGILRFNGEIFQRAAKAAFAPSAIPGMILSGFGEENTLTYNIGHGVRATETVPKALEQLAETLVHSFEYKYVHVFVADENERKLRSCLVIRSDADGVPQRIDTSDATVTYYQPDSLVGLVADSMEAILAPDVLHDTRRNLDLWKKVGQPTGAVLNLPITPDGKELIGVFGVGADTAQELQDAANDLRKLAHDIAPLIKRLQLKILREQLFRDAQQYGTCYTQADVVGVLCKSLQRALKPISVEVYRRTTGSWELQSYSGFDLSGSPAIREMVHGHLDHVGATPTQLCHPTVLGTKRVVRCSTAMLFHTQANISSANQGEHASDFAVIVVSETPFGSPEHSIRHTLDAVAAATQLAVPSLRQVTQREYVLLQSFYQGALHELSTPLFRIKVLYEAMQNSFGRLPVGTETETQVKAMLAGTSSALAQLTECEEEMRAVLTHANDGAVTISLRQEVLKRFENAGIMIRTPSDELVPQVRGHPGVWRLCLRNLISNAREATCEDAPIAVDVRVTSEAVTLTVTDNGTGLPPDIPPEQLYEPGYSTKERLDSRPRGFGLAFVRMMLDQHGGSFSLSNRRDTPGAEATMTIPRINSGAL